MSVMKALLTFFSNPVKLKPMTRSRKTNASFFLFSVGFFSAPLTSLDISLHWIGSELGKILADVLPR